MLQLFDKNKNKVKGLIKYKDYKVESVLSSGDKTLSFSYPAKLGKEIQEEGYIQTRIDEFVIKHIDTKNGWFDITAKMNVEDLEGQTWTNFNTTEVTINDCLTTAIAGTGWAVKINGSITKKRTVKKTNCSSWEVIQEAKKVYRVEIQFDTLNKIVQVYQKIGSDKGVYFIDSLNLKTLEIQSDSYDFYTRILAYGKDDIKVIVENHQYSNKIKTLIWKDERYTDVNSLKEDAIYKLDEISKPKRAYSAEIIDLANMNEKYKDILSYSLGDTVTLIDGEKDFKDKQRIVKITEYPEEPHRNTCELANTKLTFEDVQKEEKDAVDTINNITSDNGTIAESALQGILDNLNSKYISVATLNAATARIGALESTTIKTTELTAYKAEINNLFAKKADIDVLNAGIERVKVIEGKVADFDNVLAKNITADNIKAGAITAGSGIIADGAIGSAQISEVNAGKIKVGILDTTNVTIAGANSRLTLKGNRLQVFDLKDNKLFERVSIGDINNDGTVFGIRVRGADGKTNLLDENGVTAEGFTDGYNKLENDSLDPSKIDIEKAITRINNGKTIIQSSRVFMDNVSLDVQFKTLSDNLNNINVGIRNLIMNSAPNDLTDWGSAGVKHTKEIIAETTAPSQKAIKVTYSAVGYGGVFKGCIQRPIIGKQYSWSVWLKASKNLTVNVGHELGGVKTYNVTTTWQKFTYTFIAEEHNTSAFIAYANATSVGDILYIHSVKLEEGNIATDWTPAPEDIQTQIDDHTVQISANTNAISAKLDTQTYTSKMTALDGSIATFTDNLKKATGRIDVLQDSIKLKVSENDVTNILTKQHIALSFKDIVNGVFDGNNFTKNTGGTAWNGGFASVNTLSNGQYVEYTVSKLNNRVMLGVSTTNKDANYTAIDYAIYTDYSTSNNVTTQVLRIFEKGINKGTFGSFVIGDQLRVSIERNVVLYYKNGELIYTSLTTPTLPMIIDTSFYDIGSEMGDIKIGSTLSGIATRINSAESNITQLSKSIELKVEQSDITSAITDAKKGIQNQINIVYSQLKIDTNGISQVVSSLSKDSKDNSDRLQILETNTTATAITTSITNAINANKASFKTTKFTLDINGATIKNGGITVQNNTGKNVMWVDTNGKLSTDNLEVYGVTDASVNLTGNGNKGIGLRSSSGGTCYVDFCSGGTGSRIASYNSQLNNLFIEVPSSVIIRGKNSTSSGNAAADLKVFGYISFDSVIKSLGGGITCIQAGATDEIRLLNGSGGYGYVACRTISCTGGKPAIVNTKNYKETFMWSEESTHVVFNDDGSGVIDETGLCYVYLDKRYLETVTTNLSDYNIQLTGWKGSNVEIYDKQPTYFIVSGTVGKKFDWKMSAERKGFERLRFNGANLEI